MDDVTTDILLDRLRAINATAPFNRWCGVEVCFLHAGLVGAVIDTACGFAASTLTGRVLASRLSGNRLRPAVGERFVARARVVKPGKSQGFASGELFAESAGAEKLVATGETSLVVLGADPAV